MPSTFSPNFHLELQATGENAGTWGQVLDNGVFSILDAALGNTLSLPLTNTNVTLNTAQSQNNFIDLSGTLTGNVQIIFPAIGRTYFVRNGTTGNFSVTLKTAVAGATYVLQQGQTRFIVLNGTDVLLASDGFGGQTNVASAATVNLGAVTSHYANITGTAAITSFGSSASTATPIYLVTFAGALTLTYNATSLITPSAGNIYTQAGDSAIMLYLGSGNWQVLGYFANTFIPAVQPIAGGYKNLVITATGNATATLTADALTLEDTTGRAYRARAVSLALNMATSGANGLDTGAETANTWYSLWAIYNPTTNTLACLASISATAPTMPAGYTYKARFGWLRNDASANLWRTIQKGCRAAISIGTNPTTSPLIVNGSSGDPRIPTWTAVGVTNFVPPTAASIRGTIILDQGNSTRSILAPSSSYGAWDSVTNGPPIGTGNNGINNSIIFINEQFDFLLESTSIYYASSNNGTSVLLNGWDDNL